MYNVTGNITKANGSTEKLTLDLPAISYSLAVDEFERRAWAASSSREDWRTVSVVVEDVQFHF